MDTFDLESLIRELRCVQSTTPTCIDLILTNQESPFKNSNVFKVLILITIAS